MSENTTEIGTAIRAITRRDVLKSSAVIGGTIVWAVPMMTTVAEARPAGSSPPPPPLEGETYSELAFIVTCPAATYRIKYSPQDEQVGLIAPSDCGPTWTLGTGKNEGSAPCDDFHKGTGVANCPSTLLAQATLHVDGSVSVLTSGGCEITSYAWHNGQCCFEVNSITQPSLTFAGTPPNGSKHAPCP
jgi:hypothetical protein